MSQDDSLRRQLRFALFLQVGGALMFSLAFIARVTALGLDVVKAIYGLVTLLILGAVVVTAQRLRSLGR